ncbi:hypothetical protein SteCoe_27880 [Stentor coeruleus]|uniref:Uncharacterized protein n=1 Tax=Stentor coeruleus TaxID=5963 RepID=A0A1R2B9J0_9CILI|nr:hypothetical protein SteCoe_27880 [Stentor coeruleus]
MSDDEIEVYDPNKTNEMPAHLGFMKAFQSISIVKPQNNPQIPNANPVLPVEPLMNIEKKEISKQHIDDPYAENQSNVGLRRSEIVSFGKKKENPFFDVEFSISHLAEGPLDSIVPVCIQNTYEIVGLDFQIGFADIISSITLDSKRHLLELANELNDKHLELVSPAIVCKCGKPGKGTLPCMHPICENCSNHGTGCKVCGKNWAYSGELYLKKWCMKCKMCKDQLTKCQHYCYNCIANDLRVFGVFKCLICCVEFNENSFSEVQAECFVCKKTGKYLLDLFQEICEGHYHCFACSKNAIKSRKCLVCYAEMTSQTVYKLRKQSRFLCVSCDKIRNITVLTPSTCCGTRVCKKCSDLSKCVLCLKNRS